MNSKKLSRIIEIIVQKEIKKQLPAMVSEGIAKSLMRNSIARKSKSTNTPNTKEKKQDMFTLAESVLNRERNSIKESEHATEIKSLSKNPILNQILNETKPFRDGAALDYDDGNQYDQTTHLNEDFKNMDKTIGLDSNGAAGGMDALRSQMASKMGYGDMVGQGPQQGGLGVQTGVPSLDKAMNRNYSELVKKFKK